MRISDLIKKRDNKERLNGFNIIVDDNDSLKHPDKYKLKLVSDSGGRFRIRVFEHILKTEL